MTPEEVVKNELLEYIGVGNYLQAYVRLMQILDPDLYQVAQLIDEARKHGHGQIIINVGKGKINSSNLTKSYIIS